MVPQGSRGLPRCGLVCVRPAGKLGLQSKIGARGDDAARCASKA